MHFFFRQGINIPNMKLISLLQKAQAYIIKLIDSAQYVRKIIYDH